MNTALAGLPGYSTAVDQGPVQVPQLTTQAFATQEALATNNVNVAGVQNPTYTATAPNIGQVLAQAPQAQNPEAVILQSLNDKIRAMGVPAQLLASITNIEQIFTPQVLNSISPAERIEAKGKLSNLIDDLAQIAKNRSNKAASDAAFTVLINLAKHPLAAKSRETNTSNRTLEESLASLVSQSARDALVELIRNMDESRFYFGRNTDQDVNKQVVAKQEIIEKVAGVIPELAQHNPQAIATIASGVLINNFYGVRNDKLTQLAESALDKALASNPEQAIRGLLSSLSHGSFRYIDNASVSHKLEGLTKIQNRIEMLNQQYPQLARDFQLCLQSINELRKELVDHNNIAGFPNTVQQQPVMTTTPAAVPSKQELAQFLTERPDLVTPELMANAKNAASIAQQANLQQQSALVA